MSRRFGATCKPATPDWFTTPRSPATSRCRLCPKNHHRSYDGDRRWHSAVDDQRQPMPLQRRSARRNGAHSPGSPTTWPTPRWDPRLLSSFSKVHNEPASRKSSSSRSTGVVQAPGNAGEDPDGFAHGGWSQPYIPEHGIYLQDTYRQAGSFIFGRKTYEIFEGYWPTVTDPNTSSPTRSTCCRSSWCRSPSNNPLGQTRLLSPTT